mgnify:CR=1 FL=1
MLTALKGLTMNKAEYIPPVTEIIGFADCDIITNSINGNEDGETGKH